MANRHLLRSIVLQTLFECDFKSKKNGTDAIEILRLNVKEFAPEVVDISFAEDIIKGIEKYHSDLDDIITKAAPNWPIDRIAIIDRNILRIGLFELLFSDYGDVPPKVAINEAIELAKTFGGDTSSKFVNGVLGAIYKEMGEPGKNDENQEESNIPVEKLAGGVVYAKHEGDIYLALVHDVFGKWTLSKGRIENKEELEKGVVKVIRDEIGLEVKVECVLGENEYVAKDENKEKVKKQVTYFLTASDFDELVLKKEGGLDDAKWFRMKDVVDLNLYEDIIPIITKAVGILLAKNGDTNKKEK